MMGRIVGASRGKGGTMHIAKPDKGVMLSTGIVGAGPPVGVWLAMAAKRKGLDRVTVVSFGDGATNTGSFHEAANMAALWDLPMVLVCQNNQYAEMTPTAPPDTGCRASASTATTRWLSRQRWTMRWTGRAAVTVPPSSSA